MQLNTEDNGNRQFIMVQLPELTDEKAKPIKLDLKPSAKYPKNAFAVQEQKSKPKIPIKPLIQDLRYLN